MLGWILIAGNISGPAGNDGDPGERAGAVVVLENEDRLGGCKLDDRGAPPNSGLRGPMDNEVAWIWRGSCGAD